MVAAPTLPLVSVEDYLAASYEVPCEYVDGVVLEKHVGKRTHGLMLGELYSLFKSFEQRHGIRVYLEQHIKIGPNRYRIPDVLIMRANHKREEILTESPVCTFEIVSPGEGWAELTGKYKDHHAMGVESIVIADPYARTLFAVNAEGSLHEIAAPLTISLPMPTGGNLAIDFDKLYASLD